MKKYKCDNTQNVDLKSHITAVHEKIEKFNCVDCGKNFAKGSNLKIHIQTVHEKENSFFPFVKKDLENCNT